MTTMTGHQLLSTWAKFGAAHFVRKVGRKWGLDKRLGNVNHLWQTKREAIAIAETTIMASLDRSRANGEI